MANWFYTNEKGEKVSVTGGQLKGLAKAGLITSDTIVETEDGKIAPARKVKGLTFAMSAKPKPTSPAETESYGLVQPLKPPVTSNPFTAPKPQSQSPSPFTAALPVTESPFVGSMQTAGNQAVLRRDSVSIADEIKLCFLFLVLGLLVVFAVIGIASNLGGGNRSSAGGGGGFAVVKPLKQEVPVESPEVKLLKEAIAIARNFDNAVTEDFVWKMEESQKKFGGISSTSFPPELTSLHSSLLDEMYRVVVIRKEHVLIDQLPLGRGYYNEKVQVYRNCANKFIEAADREMARLQGKSAVGNVAGQTKRDDVNSKDADGNTLLHKAAREGRLESVKNLISKGANVNAKGRNLDTPLHLAVEYNKNVEIVKFLISKGADVNAKSLGSVTPLHFAVGRNKDLNIVEILVSEGADVNARNIDGLTPLHFSAGNADVEVVKFLISKGADVNAKDQQDNTPLHQVGKVSGNVEIAKFLVTKGVNVNATNKDGKTPLDLAKAELPSYVFQEYRQNQPALVQYLSGLK